MTSTKSVCLVEATRQEYEEWLQQQACGGVTLNHKDSNLWVWVSPTGVCITFVTPAVPAEQAQQAIEEVERPYPF